MDYRTIFKSFLLRLLYDKYQNALGVTIIGGCCGTTPEYIRKIRTILPKN
ncbi:MAG TPA: hypothetical protein ENN20_09200 [Candidatus Marinimicrobia bacterium]|nr:hypothetical protein [Candidatus Neomarinimicrobiota bacterium]